MIAGFEQPTFGIVELGGHDVSRLAPSDRIPAHERASRSRIRVQQRQRVALAHAPVNRPTAPLSDEPLGALDLRRRNAMPSGLKQRQRDVDITFVFVTRDQDEALTMSETWPVRPVPARPAPPAPSPMRCTSA